MFKSGIKCTMFLYVLTSDEDTNFDNTQDTTVQRIQPTVNQSDSGCRYTF